MTTWSKGILFGAASILAVAVTYVWVPSDRDVAGIVFGWKLTFYLPALFISLCCWVVALCYDIKNARLKKEKSGFRSAMASILLLPFIYEAGSNVVLIWRISR